MPNETKEKKVHLFGCTAGSAYRAGMCDSNCRGCYYWDGTERWVTLEELNMMNVADPVEDFEDC
ncbi:MAG: hypothetical protein ACOZBH_03780 [Patescibacteria group bacterium]